MNDFDLRTTIFACAVALAGCINETVSSKDVRTGGIAALIGVEAPSDTLSTVYVTLLVGGDESNTFVHLEGGDRLWAEAAGDRRAMDEEETGFYTTAFPTADGDTEFRVVLQRSVDETASENVGVLPDPLTLEVPEEVSRAEDLFVTWSPSGREDDVSLDVQGDCLGNSTDIDVPGDPGNWVIPAGTLRSNDGENALTCSPTVTLSRRRSGAVDPAFDSESTFELAQVRRAVFVSTP